MMIPAIFATAVSAFMSGPFDKIISAYVQDLALQRKLKAEIESSMLVQLGKAAELGQAVVLTEVGVGNWLTRSWRPILMLVLIFFLLLVGFVLPVADLVAGRTVPFNPRWQALPDGFWNFLSVGVGGYIGGRSLEKIAAGQFPQLNLPAKKR